MSHPSIDTPEFRELLGKVYSQDKFDFLTPNAATEALIAYIDARPPVQEAPQLTVWENPMPESNGKSNFTAILTRKDATGFDIFTDGFTIARSEYPDRVRYEADCIRYIIGELKERPEIWLYDENKRSDYVAPAVPKTGSLKWDLVNVAANAANTKYGSFMPTQWINAFVVAYNDAVREDAE